MAILLVALLRAGLRLHVLEIFTLAVDTPAFAHRADIIVPGLRGDHASFCRNSRPMVHLTIPRALRGS